jgi:hypothetical protein
MVVFLLLIIVAILLFGGPAILGAISNIWTVILLIGIGIWSTYFIQNIGNNLKSIIILVSLTGLAFGIATVIEHMILKKRYKGSKEDIEYKDFYKNNKFPMDMKMSIGLISLVILGIPMLVIMIGI